MFNTFFRSLAFSVVALFICCFAWWGTSYANSPTLMCSGLYYCNLTAHDIRPHTVSIYGIFPHSKYTCFIQVNGIFPVHISNIRGANTSYTFPKYSGTSIGPIVFTNNTNTVGSVTFDYNFGMANMYLSVAYIHCVL